MLTYTEAQALMATARDPRAGKPLANNTRLFPNGDDSYAVRLHATDIVLLEADGTYVLIAGGWQTVTTKDRINAFSPARVYSDRGTWYVQHPRNGDDPRPAYVPPRQDGRREYLRESREWQDRNRTPFHDGITVDASGMPAEASSNPARRWCKDNGLKVRNGHVTLWKAVDRELMSRWGTTYKPRTTVVAPDYRPTQDCGNGLHFGPTPDVAARYHGDRADMVLLKCRVPLESLIPLADKCKARECYVVGRFSPTL